MTQFSEDVGMISIDTESIQFISKLYGNWQVKLKDVAVIGEYTTEDGPLMEDHYFVVIDNDGNEYVWPVNALGVKMVIKKIECIFEFKVNLELTLNTGFSSRVIFPYSLKGRELYVFRYKEINILKRMFSLGRVERIFSKELKSFLKRQK